MFTCVKCGQLLPLDCFRKDSALTRGHRADCNDCRAARRRAAYAADPSKVKTQGAAWRAANADKRSASQKAYRERNAAAISEAKKRCYQAKKTEYNAKSNAYYRANKDAAKARQKLWNEANADKLSAYFSEWRRANPGRRREYMASRRAAKDNRTPAWVDRGELLKVYELARFLRETGNPTVEVDHIIPLRGKTVSGLHVPWNLCVRPKVVNVRKALSWSEDEALAKHLGCVVAWGELTQHP